MDEGTKTKKLMHTPEEWAQTFRTVRERLLTERARLQAHYDTKTQEAKEQDDPYYYEPTRSFTKHLVTIYDELLLVWDRTNAEREWLADRNRQMTEFLDKFQKWMDLYGPMLEAERKLREKIE